MSTSKGEGGTDWRASLAEPGGGGGGRGWGAGRSRTGWTLRAGSAPGALHGCTEFILQQQASGSDK